MNLREEYARLRRLAFIAREVDLPPAHVSVLIQPFIDRYKNLRLTRAGDTGGMAVSVHPQAEAISHAVRLAALALQRRGVKGIRFHNALQRAVAKLGDGFGYRGFMECGALYETPEGLEVAGRMDVVWATGRVPTVLFEVDSTAKRASLEKLQLAEAPHKFWVFFGRDVWGFKTLLARHDPERTVVPVVVPWAFAPDGGNHGD